MGPRVHLGERFPAASLPLAFALGVMLALPCLADDATRASGATRSAIDGPPPPEPPEVVSRDSQGRVTLRAERVSEPPKIDGLLDDAVYSRVPAISDFFQQEPREGEAATERTEVWLLFDAKNIYVSARCWDSDPGRIVANEMRRDSQSIFENDNFGVIFDTFHDRRNGFFFYTNPVGGMSDSYVTDERDSNRDWNTVWYTQSRRFDEGWTVEMAIPFKSLRYKGGAAQVWGVNFRRIIRGKNEFSYLTRIPASFGRRGMQKLSSAATLVGIEAPGSSRNLELKPYGVSSLVAERREDGSFPNDLGGDVGFDLKYGLTRSLTFDFTYNTDFAQVEEDEQQVNLTRFSLFFPEKRDFFLEGQGIFAFGSVQTPRGGFGGPGDTPVIFYSRRIGLSEGLAVPIRAGGRLTGKAGPYSLGLLNIQSGADPVALAESTNFSVVRLKRDILRRSNVGVIGTRRSKSFEAPGANELWGIDANFSFFESLNLLGYYARSRTPGLEGDDSSHRARLDYAGDRYGLELERLEVGARFNPEVGFLRREDFTRSFARGRFSPRPRGLRGVRRFSFEASLEYYEDGRGRLESRSAQLQARAELSSGDSASLEYEDSYELLEAPFEISDEVTIPPGGYGFPRFRASYQLGPQRRLSGFLNLSLGRFYGGQRTDLSYRGRVEITPRLSLEPTLSRNWVDLPEGRFTTTLAGARVSMSFSPRAALAGLVQYSSSSRRLNTNLRFRWEYVPGSDLFVVYSDARDTQGAGFPRQANRSLAIKLTRLVRF